MKKVKLPNTVKYPIALMLSLAMPLSALAADVTNSPGDSGAGAQAQPAAAQPPARGPRRGGGFGGGAPVLGPDDKPAEPEPPASVVQRREDIPHGTLTVVKYDSKSLGTHRQVRVYTPPGYSADKKYPVLYLLHGIGGNDLEWVRAVHADNILDGLLADHKIVPMVVVFPNGNSAITADAGDNFTGEDPAARRGGAPGGGRGFGGGGAHGGGFRGGSGGGHGGGHR